MEIDRQIAIIESSVENIGANMILIHKMLDEIPCDKIILRELSDSILEYLEGNTKVFKNEYYKDDLN